MYNDEGELVQEQLSIHDIQHLLLQRKISMFGSLPSDGLKVSQSEPDKKIKSENEKNVEKIQENELKKLYQPFGQKKPVEEMYKTTVRPSKPNTPGAALDVLKKVQNLVSQYQTTTIIPKFGFDIAPIGNVGVIERTKTKEKPENKVKNNDKNNDDYN